MKFRTISLVLLFCLMFSSIVCFSQNDGKKFTHTIQTTLGTRSLSHQNDDRIYGNFYLNLIPSYELGYKNKFFVKLRYANYYYDKIQWIDLEPQGGVLTQTTYLYPILEQKQRIDVYSIVLSYNILNRVKRHNLKLGLDMGCGFTKLYGDMRYKQDDKNNLIELGLELSYKFYINQHFAIGAEADFGSLSRVGYETQNLGLNATLSYTF